MRARLQAPQVDPFQRRIFPPSRPAPGMYLPCLPRTASPGRSPPRPSIHRDAATALTNAHGFTSTSTIVCDSCCLPPRALLQPECGFVLQLEICGQAQGLSNCRWPNWRLPALSSDLPRSPRIQRRHSLRWSQTCLQVAMRAGFIRETNSPGGSSRDGPASAKTNR